MTVDVVGNVGEDLASALSNALLRYAETMGEPFEHSPELRIHNDDTFWALIRPEKSGAVLQINTGVVGALDQVLDIAWHQPILTRGDGATLSSSTFDDLRQGLHQSALEWLMLHELMHARMSHFDIVPEAAIVQTTSKKPAYDVKPSIVDASSVDDPLLIRRCIEMQADGEATDILLGAYSAEKWDLLRIRLAAIGAMLCIIERENTASASPSPNHPRGSTRFFALLGHQ